MFDIECLVPSLGRVDQYILIPVVRGEQQSYGHALRVSARDGQVGHGEKTFRGNKQIGPLIIEASWIAITKDAGLGSQYLNYRRRMESQKAIVRMARKMSNVIFAVLKNKTKYEPCQTDK